MSQQQNVFPETMIADSNMAMDESKSWVPGDVADSSMLRLNSFIIAAVKSLLPMMVTSSSLLVAALAIVAGLLYLKQDQLLYFPEVNGLAKRTSDNPSGYRSPEESNLPYENYFIPCDDGVHIHAWLIIHSSVSSQYLNSRANPDPSIPTIIFFHGNAGNIGLRLPNAIQMRYYLRCHILMVEYRGYGNSDNVRPNEVGLMKDAEAVLKFIRTSHNNQQPPQHHTHSLSMPSFVINPNNLVVFGQSLGGAVALHLASYAEHVMNQPIQGVIVENTFTSISDMVDALLPFLRLFKPYVLRINWNSLFLVQTKLEKTPILYLSGAKDELVPPSQMKKLFDNTLPHLRHWYSVPTGTHNETWIQGGRQYWDAIRSFFHKILPTSVS
jgi:abhydrolase domain-containing protein 13